MQRLSRRLILKETARRAAHAEQSHDYVMARALWHQVYAASGPKDNTRWAEARRLFCERQLYHHGMLNTQDPGSDTS
ncbi:TPA: ANR family transcriptional regulator [Salmonella enterica subsp. diarizonae serovar 61:l,v:z35]|nr:ANR family transcriptional regulator [Salmonella enterica subsp. enterica serovar Newport]